MGDAADPCRELDTRGDELMRKRSGSRKRYAVGVMTLLLAMTMVVSSVGAVDSPWIDVETPIDGSFLTYKDVLVTGNATPDTRSLSLGREEFENGTMTNTKMRGENLTFNPVALFVDDFSGPGLNTQKWTILQDPGNVSIESGALKLDYLWSWPNPSTNYPQVRSSAATPMEGADIITEFKLKFTAFGYSASGGGVSSGNMDFDKSHMSVKSMYTFNPVSWFTVYAGGEPVLNTTGYDYEYHIYKLEYKASSDRYYCYRDGELLAGFTKATAPTTFWFGPGEEGLYAHRSPLMVDYVEMWALTGEWLSPVIDIGYEAILDGAVPTWDSSHPRTAQVNMWVRASDDAENWTDWIPLVDGVPEGPVDGRYLQLKSHLSIPGIKDTRANLRLTEIRLDYHAPLTSVEVRPWGGEWAPVEGLEQWQAQMELQEDANVIQVRVTDASGAVNMTSISVTVDTIPPVGTMEILGDYAFTNDLNVTIRVDATDKYGVEYVDVSNYLDFSRKTRFAYTEDIPWTMVGAEGESWVYVRFIDSHGLMSTPASDHVIFDSFPPRGEIIIDQGSQYTPQHVVALTFSYSDNNDVAKVEIANEPTFTEPFDVPMGVEAINNWQLTEGGDGKRVVYLRVTDVARNIFVISDDIELYLPKAVGGVTIEGGADLTGKTVVDLSIDLPLGANVQRMQLSNNPSFEGATWETANKDRRWFLDPEDGIKTVYIRYLDKRDIVSLPVNDTIRLDTTAPSVNLTLDGGAVYTIDTRVDGVVVYEDPSEPVRMWVSEDDSFDRVRDQDFSETFEWTVKARESDHWVYLRVEDAAGNVGETSAKIHYATIIPIIKLSLPEGDVTRATDVIPVEITPIDPYGGVEVQLTFDNHPTEDTPWMPVSGLFEVEIPDGSLDGPHQIHARARNAAGLESGVESIDLVLDTVAPSLAILYPVDGSSFNQKGLKLRLEIDASDSTRIMRMVYILDEGEPRDMPDDELFTNVTLPGFGDHIIQVTVEDAAGNIATSTSVFTVEDANLAHTSAGLGLLSLVVLVLLVSAGIAAYGYRRSRTPGLRSVKLLDGDGWHHDWTHPHLEEDGEVECAKVPVVPEQVDHFKEVKRVAAEAAEAAPEAAPEGSIELEQVAMPDELGSEEGTTDDWKEF
jgi:hypothetical protein